MILSWRYILASEYMIFVTPGMKGCTWGCRHLLVNAHHIHYHKCLKRKHCITVWPFQISWSHHIKRANPSPILPSIPHHQPIAPAAPASALAQELIQNGSACWPGCKSWCFDGWRGRKTSVAGIPKSWQGVLASSKFPKAVSFFGRGGLLGRFDFKKFVGSWELESIRNQKGVWSFRWSADMRVYIRMWSEGCHGLPKPHPSPRSPQNQRCAGPTSGLFAAFIISACAKK